MIQPITAKTLLASVKQPDSWFGLRYIMNLYRGCQHRCIYCDSRSLCYGIEAFDRDVLVKVNAIERLRDELPRKRVKGTIGTGSMNDPYMPLEKREQLTRRALMVIADFHFPVHVITKSDLVQRDVDVLQQIGQVYTAVSFTLTTTDDTLARKIEPGAPLPSARLAAMRSLAAQGIYTGVTLMPVLPFLTDTADSIRAIVQQSAAAGAAYIIASFGLTLRDRQRSYYYEQLARHFPGLPQRYAQTYGPAYFAPAAQAKQLAAQFSEMCAQVGIATRIRPYQSPRQLTLL